MIHTLSTLLHECTFVKIRLMYSFQDVKTWVRDSHVSRMGKQRTIFLRYARSSRITRRILARGKCIRDEYENDGSSMHRSRGGTLTRSIVDAPARRYKPNPSPLGRFHPGCSRSRLISIYIRRAPDHDVFTRDCNCAAYVYKSFVRADVVSLNHGHFVIPSWNELLLCI